MRPSTTTLLFLTLATLTFSSSSSPTSQRRQTWHQHGWNNTGTGHCLPYERDALLAFKQGITGDPAGRLASWHQGNEDCCQWRGIRCSTRNGHVVGLHLGHVRAKDDNLYAELQATALSGQISPSLLSLHHLEHLDLSLNDLSGPAGRVPEFLCRFRKLRLLNLSGLPLSGEVPHQLGNLSSLNYLDLSPANFFDGDVPWDPTRLYSTDLSWVSNLPLQYLNMDSVDLSSVTDWANVVNGVASLKVLSLSHCSLTSANQSLAHLNFTDLEELSLSGNFLDNAASSCWFWNLTGLGYLDLAETTLYGQMPDALGGMTSLRVLDISNSVKDILMRNMTNLCNLEILDLTGSQFNGDIVGLLPQCSHTKLKELHLGGNNFTGVLPDWIGRRWSSLLILDLSSNQFTGAVPSQIGMLGSLQRLGLGSNQFSGHLPSEISMLSNLTDMDLSHNNLNGPVTHEQLDGLTRLMKIDLSGNSLKIIVDPEWLPPFRLRVASFASCQMGPPFPTWLQSQVDICTLDISNSSIFGRLPDWFSSAFSKASSLDVSNNGITGALPKDLVNMTLLQQLYLNSNNISGPIRPIPVSLGELDISENFLSGPLPPNIGTENLGYLNLASNQLSGPIPPFICQMNLGYLNLANNNFDGEFPLCSEPWAPSVLILRNNRLSGKFPRCLKTMTKLRVLDLAWNKFSGTIPAWIGDIPELMILQLSHNMFTGSIPSTITRLKALSQLNLASNGISGPLPWHLSNLTCMMMKINSINCFRPLPGTSSINFREANVNMSVVTKGQERYYKDSELYEMVSIDISLNQLTGRIPEQVASLDGVVNLNLSWNRLNGKIPNKIGAMQALESLDLSENKICGEIPESLSTLTYLSYLDLSYNNLTGRIPSGAQLDTLYVQYPFMYNGNSGLCGYPHLKSCSDNNEPNHGDHDEDEHDSIVLSFSFGLGTGYVVGLWVVFCVIFFKKPWRIAFFRLFDKAFDEVYAYVFVTCAKWAKKVYKKQANQ